jgi:hypothetical protein
MKIDFNYKFKNLDGTEIEGKILQHMYENHAGKLLGEILSGMPKNISAIKAYGWAQKLYQQGIIDIDKDDKEKLERLIEEAGIPVLFKAPLLETVKAAIE